MSLGIRHAVLLALASRALVACGGPSAPNVPAAASTTNASSKARSGDLLYVGVTHNVLILTYPEYRHVGRLATQEEWPTVCGDPKTGDVFVPDTQQISEYAHGGTTPIAVLKAPAGYGNLLGCDHNPTNRDLAVTSYQHPLDGGQLLIYQKGKAGPQIYDDPAVLAFYYCGYDPNGDLFLMGYGLKGQRSVVPILDELPVGSASLMHIVLDAYVFYPKKVQWYGGYLTLTNGKIVARADLGVSRLHREYDDPQRR
jgi:hypothetical protein